MSVFCSTQSGMRLLQAILLSLLIELRLWLAHSAKAVSKRIRSKVPRIARKFNILLPNYQHGWLTLVHSLDLMYARVHAILKRRVTLLTWEEIGGHSCMTVLIKPDFFPIDKIKKIPIFFPLAFVKMLVYSSWSVILFTFTNSWATITLVLRACLWRPDVYVILGNRNLSLAVSRLILR